MTQSSVFLRRIEQVQKGLKEAGVDGLYVSAPIDLFYLTGIRMSLGHLIIGKKKASLFVDGRYRTAVSKKSPVPVEDLSSENEGEALKGIAVLGFDGKRVPYSEFEQLRKLARKAKTKLISKPAVMQKLRLIKDRGEISKMKKAAEFGYKAYQYARRRLKTGVTELEIARDLEMYCLKYGASGMSFEPIIAFGKNSALPHHHPGKTKLKENDIALFDLGVVLDSYCSDMTRVVFHGKENKELKHIFEVNRAAQRMALAKVRPGIALKELDIAARRVMATAELEEYYVHNLGHGIGLEVHEFPSISKKGVDRNFILEAGMVITIEPGIYLPGKGGVRYEDTIVVTSVGYTNLYPET